MRVAYLDCFAGVAGDMFLGALIDAGVPEDVLQQATATLAIDASLRIEKVDRSGISCTKVHVLENGKLAEAEAHTHEYKHAHEHKHDGEHGHKHDHGHKHEHSHSHEHDEKHEHGHSHEHKHAHEHNGNDHSHKHTHGRSLTEIRNLIRSTSLAEPVKQLAVRAFELLGQSEAKIHNVPVDKIHFHEVGAVDAIVDIVASAAGIHHLNIQSWYSSPLNVGGGMVQCAHGNFPVPAPATADLLRGIPTYSAHVEKELVTPTGAALIRALEPTIGAQPAMTVAQIGYGAGTRNPKGFPNVLRLSIGEIAVPDASKVIAANRPHTASSHPGLQTVTVIETALDDASPQLIAYVAEQALATGALDVMLTPVIMKKGRPGTLMTVLAEPARSAALQELLLRETPTLGVRLRTEERTCLDREHVSVETEYGPVRMKLGLSDGEQRNAAPEFEDCKAAALRSNVPLKLVQQAAIASFGNEAKRS